MSRFLVRSSVTVSGRGFVAACVAAVGPFFAIACYWWFATTFSFEMAFNHLSDGLIIWPALGLFVTVAGSIGAFLVFLIERRYSHRVEVLSDRDPSRSDGDP